MESWRRNRFAVLGFLACAASVLSASQALSETIILTAIDSGWIDEADSRFLFTAPNYIAGRCLGCSTGESELRDFFIFDLSSVNRTIESATLLLDSGSRYSNTGRPNEEFELHDVGYDPHALFETGGTHPGLFGDLGSGVLFARVSLSMQCCEAQASLPLNSDAIAALNAADDLFAFGGRVSSLGPPTEDVRLFGGTHNPPNDRSLVLVLVPEPSTSMLVSIGLAMIGARVRALHPARSRQRSWASRRPTRRCS